jgi:hypothetical protein
VETSQAAVPLPLLLSLGAEEQTCGVRMFLGGNSGSSAASPTALEETGSVRTESSKAGGGPRAQGRTPGSQGRLMGDRTGLFPQ